MKREVPEVLWNKRLIDGNGDYHWVEEKTADIFKDRNVVVFSLPGAWTPTCSTKQLPEYEKRAQEFYDLGIDDVYCLSVNDSFTMNAWFRFHEIKNILPIADGNADFTRLMGLLVEKKNLCFGLRSQRYSMHVTNKVIRQMFVEGPIADNFTADPFFVSSAGTMLGYLRGDVDESVLSR
tara:strand:- start:1352 stop:1888 length:537 start_codon:yes stop_codon:yes gene_type:complete